MTLPTIGGELAWHPSEEVFRATTLAAFLRRHALPDLDALMVRADAEPQWYWQALLEFFHIHFARPYSKVLDSSRGIEWPRWCVDGTTNVTLNCLDRHRNSATWSKPALIWEGEDDATRTWTYAEMSTQTDSVARALRTRGIGRGDVVAIYLPMIPEAAAAFFAIAKIGAIVMPLFSGFGPQPIVERLNDSEARAVITTDITWRRGKVLRPKDTLDVALQSVKTVHTVVVVRRAEESGNWRPARDIAWPPPEEGGELATELVDAETPVMLMYTSGTTGKPKGTVHTHCGVLAKNALDMGLCIDLKAQDRLMWMSDMGWIVGPKIVISGALLGATLVIAEATPDWPDPIRMWRMAARHGVTIIGVVPTMVRQMMRNRVEDALAQVDLSALRATISVGEPWTVEAWEWFFRHVCREKLPILNYAGGTECGGAILIGSFARTIRPCAFSHPVPGCGADVVDSNGRSLGAGEMGELVMRNPSIGMTRGLWKSPDRYIESYWRVIPHVWVQGDLASRDAGDLWYLHGRSDDTIKIAGKRTGPAEVEAVLIGTGLVADAAVVAVPDAITGSALACACVLMTKDGDLAATRKSLSDAVAAELGPSYRPRHLFFAADLPRTRNQKIMRRVVRAVLTGIPPGDLSSLANPESLEDIRRAWQDASQ